MFYYARQKYGHIVSKTRQTVIAVEERNWPGTQKVDIEDLV